MRITFSVDDEIVIRAREKLRARGKSLNDEIRQHLKLTAEGDEIERNIRFLRETAGQGRPEPGWKWNRDELYEDRLKLRRE